jgi:aryl-phospho-beta-D-glucosidase BglC (GH1 family)
MFRKSIQLFFLIFLFGCSQKIPEPESSNSSKIMFWNKIQRGANIFNVKIYREDIRAAKKYGIKFVRLSLDKWPTKRKDFLIGDADDYVSLDLDDLAFLKKILAIFEEEKMSVVITMLGLPGCRWTQHNQNRYDSRIWNDPNYRKQAIKFWKDLAQELRNYSNVIGYNILNEPRPENHTSGEIQEAHDLQKAARRPLFEFYGEVVKEIRKVDPDTPIILDSSAYADPGTFKYLRPMNDKFVIYSFHMYEPYEYTNHRNVGKYSYPGIMSGKYWDKKALENYMKAVTDFQKTYKISSNRILVGEFGGYRKQCGLSQYFEDLIQIFEKNQWHWAFYAFREDAWDGMDYELGDQKLPWSYWQAIEKGETPNANRKDSHLQFVILKKAMN